MICVAAAPLFIFARGRRLLYQFFTQERFSPPLRSLRLLRPLSPPSFSLFSLPASRRGCRVPAAGCSWRCRPSSAARTRTPGSVTRTGRNRATELREFRSGKRAEEPLDPRPPTDRRRLGLRPRGVDGDRQPREGKAQGPHFIRRISIVIDTFAVFRFIPLLTHLGDWL